MERPKNYLDYNRQAWDFQVQSGNEWTIPVGASEIENARKGEWQVVLTPQWPVPHNWFPEKGARVLGLASAGGQQGPLLAAAGYDVTVFDNSEAQLGQDRKISDQYQLGIKTVHGDMADLSVFEQESFDLVFNPCSTGFVKDVAAVYREVARVLKKGGIFMTGFVKPEYYLFDVRLVEQGIFTLKYSAPYSDLDSLDDGELRLFTGKNEPVIFAHSWEAYLDCQLQAGLQLTHLREDSWGRENPIDRHFPAFIATRAVKGVISY